MNKDTFIVSTYDGVVADRLQQTFKDLYEAVYREDKEDIESLFIHILDDILKHYPTKPNINDASIKGDLHALELLIADFDMDYADYLSDVKGIESSSLWSETSSIPYKLVENPLGLKDLIGGIYDYLLRKENKYSYTILVAALEEYKKHRHIKALY